ncbi:MAG: hypothetical protein IT290_10250 [Deltaproteobacteria bacterium]|nr:hypothetical protein [Deltaproteobacteria bacterium]
MKALTAIACCALLYPTINLQAEDINVVFKKVNEYVAQQNYPKAMEELSWARKELERLHSIKVATLLPNELNGFTGAAPKTQAVLGMSTIERNYTSGKQRIEVSIAGGTPEGMGGLAGLAKMGMMMEANEPGNETFRLDGRTATLKAANPNSPEMTVVLESGQIMTIQGKGVDVATLKTFAEALKIGDIDNYLKGGTK